MTRYNEENTHNDRCNKRRSNMEVKKKYFLTITTPITDVEIKAEDIATH
jgi:hypothetical protein